MPRTAFSVAAPPRSRPPTAALTSQHRARRHLGARRPARTGRLVARRADADLHRAGDPVPDHQAALARPGGSPLPLRPVRPRGVHDLERPVVRRPPHARLLDPLAAARLAARACRCWARISAVASTIVFTELARRHWGARAARWGTVWFGFGSATLLATNRIPFALGTAFGAGRRAGAAARSPPAGAAARRAQRHLEPGRRPVRGDGRRRVRARRTGRGRADQAPRRPRARGRRVDPAGAAHGRVPRGRLRPVPVLRLPADPAVRRRRPGRAAPHERTLRIGAVLYALGATARAGGADRHGRERGAAGSAARRPGDRVRARRQRVSPGRSCRSSRCSCALGFWQWSAAARDIYKAATDPVAQASYFDPVREYLRLLPDQRRVEIPFTLGHWEGAEVATEAPLARGWLRQLDTGRQPDLLQGRAERAHLRELAVGERRALRGAARRQARPQRIPRAGADRERPAVPQAARAASTTGASTRSPSRRRS